MERTGREFKRNGVLHGVSPSQNKIRTADTATLPIQSLARTFSVRVMAAECHSQKPFATFFSTR